MTQNCIMKSPVLFNLTSFNITSTRFSTGLSYGNSLFPPPSALRSTLEPCLQTSITLMTFLFAIPALSKTQESCLIAVSNLLIIYRILCLEQVSALISSSVASFVAILTIVLRHSSHMYVLFWSMPLLFGHPLTCIKSLTLNLFKDLSPSVFHSANHSHMLSVQPTSNFRVWNIAD